MFNFESIFLYCMDSNYSYNKMTEVVKYLCHRLESVYEGDEAENFKELQSEVRMLILTLLHQKDSRGFERKVIKRYNQKAGKTLEYTKESLAFALGSGTQICIFDFVDYDFLYIINRLFEMDDKHTCVCKSDLETYDKEMAAVAFVSFEEDEQIKANC